MTITAKFGPVDFAEVLCHPKRHVATSGKNKLTPGQVENAISCVWDCN